MKALRKIQLQNYRRQNRLWVWLWLLAWVWIGCSNRKKNDLLCKPISITKYDTLVANTQLKIVPDILFDTLLLNDVKLNNHTFSLQYTELKKRNLDSVIHIYSMNTREWECGNPFGWDEDSLHVVYVKNQRYLTNKKESFLYYAKLNKNVLFIKHMNIKLNSETSIRDFKNIFKNAEVTKIENGYVIFNITFNPSQPEDNWMFYFDLNKKLTEFYLDWWLC